MTTPQPRPLRPGDQLLLVDGYSFVFRAYFQSINQDGKYNSRSDGLPTGAVRLFCAKLLQIMRDGVMGRTPTHLGVTFDKTEGSHRNEIFPDYKGHRPDAPSDLKQQFPLMRDAVRAFGLPPLERDRTEADDLIATYATQAGALGADVLIISADKDLMQLVDDRITFYDFESGRPGKPGYRPERQIDRAGVEAYFGVPPERVVDVQALAGDASDNVPGVPGIGVKTAAGLVREFGDLDGVLEAAKTGAIAQPKRRQALIDHEEAARMSKRLVLLDREIPLSVPVEALALPEPDPRLLLAFLKAMEFNTISRRVADLYGLDPADVEAAPSLMGRSAWKRGAADEAATDEAGAPEPDGDAPIEAALPGELTQGPRTLPSPAELAAKRRREGATGKFDLTLYETVRERGHLEAWIAAATQAGVVAFDTETNSLDAMQADLVGFSLCVEPNRACYVPLQHRAGEGEGLFSDETLSEGQIPAAEAIALLKPLLESRAVLKVGQNLKFDWLIMIRHGVDIRTYDDTMLLSYVLDSGRRAHGMDDLSDEHLGHKPITFKEVAGSGRGMVTFDRVPIDRASTYAAEDADVTLRLWRVLKPRLAAEGLAAVYETLERGMVETLARMERRGIAIDRATLARLGSEFAQKAARLEEEAQEIAGERFQLGSAKQLGDLLFGKFALPGGRKTASGQWSTTVQVLDELSEGGHPLPKKIVEWRQLTKLKSTYTDALVNAVNPQTGRVHTSFALAATNTGRLSSSDPNLQNIPIRTEEGRKIRRAFIAEPGHRILSADYSQIELRLLAHMADIPQLKYAFANGVDIHAVTASEMFGVPVDAVPGDMRRQAKTINFGIIYGISAFGLAARLGIGRDQAADYIKKYFEKFPGIRDYIDGTKRSARENAYVTTLFGRKCHFPNIRAANPQERAFNERAAINAPIQGTAADVIRRAMMRMDDALLAARLDARMLLQVHDELVFEVPEDQCEATIPVVRAIMEEAHEPAVHLTVPLAVEAHAAHNWEEAH